jgi:hypothetical protein
LWWISVAGGARHVLRCACVAGPVGAGIDVERPRGALDDLFRDHDFLYAFEARQVEHRVEQDTTSRATAPSAARTRTTATRFTLNSKSSMAFHSKHDTYADDSFNDLPIPESLL